MTQIRTLGFQENSTPVLLTTLKGVTYEAVFIDWLPARPNWAAPTGVLVQIQNPAANAPVGELLTVFIPWSNVQYITQIVPIPPQGV